MSREVKRVPLDFDWPLNKIWPGYTYSSIDCGLCPEGDDWTIEGQCAWHRYLWDLDEYPSVDPPSGDGWQLWETVSEGSPISPVFITKEELSAWMQSPDYRTPLTKEQADNFVNVGWAPSMIYTPETGLVLGEQYVDSDWKPAS